MEHGTAHPDVHGRILLVDDSHSARALIAGCLRAAGHEVIEADGGVAARERLESETTFDVVVTDLHMPGVDGFDVLAAARRRPAVEVIVLTGHHANDARAAIRALRLGAHDYLSKEGCCAEELLLSVSRAFEKRRLIFANARLLQELEALSRTDPLTGLANRRAFDERLRQEVARARRFGHPLALLALDLDHFKRVNDDYGHPAGDAVLRQFASIAGGCLREVDLLARPGGEEFSAILPMTGLVGAAQLAARVVAAVATARFVVDSAVLAVTVSAGVAAGSSDLLSPERLVAEADAALYAAKHAGRNCVRAFPQAPRHAAA
jgi:diguanylate cyclase (GGDEF)-like protein